MKKSKIGLSYTVRKLVQINEIQNLVKSLHENRQSKDPAKIYLPLVNECVTKIIEKASINREGFDLDPCFNSDDVSFLRELEKHKVISLKDIYEDEEDEVVKIDGRLELAPYGYYTADVIVNDVKFIENLNRWVNDLPSIINYGIFSLNTITGEAYCLNNVGIFLPNSGMLSVLKAFLNEPSHCLSYERIYRLFHGDEKEIDIYLMTPQSIHQIIWDIRDKLFMTGKLSKLFVSSSNQYALRPSLA